MTKSQRLKPVSEIAASHERDAAKHMGEQQRLLDAHRQKLEDLIQYRSEYSEKMLSAGSSGIGAGQMQDYSMFIRRLEEAIAFQRGQIDLAQRQLEVKQREWRAMHTRSEALDRVVTRYQVNENRERDRREQRENDDRAQRVTRTHHET